MAEGSKVRLVRCPKCGNVLTELPDYSVYQCGACDTILRAKKKVAVSDGVLVKNPGSEKDGEGFQKLEFLFEKEGGSGQANASETERRVVGESGVNLVSSNSSLSRTENQSINNNSRVVEEQNIGHHRGDGENKIDSNGKSRQPLKQPVDNWDHRDDNSQKMSRLESSNANRGKGIGENSSQFQSSFGILRSRLADKYSCGRNGTGGSYGNVSTAQGRSKVSIFAYPDEGPSNRQLGYSSYECGKHVRNYYEDLDRSNGVAYLDPDQAELLRKLDELKEQLSRSCNVDVKQLNRNTVGSKIAPSDNHHGHATFIASVQPLAPDKHLVQPTYLKRYDHPPACCASCFNTGMDNFYIPKKIPAYDYPFSQQIPRLHSYPRPWYQSPPPSEFILGRYTDFNQESVPSCNHENLYHQPVCSCSSCHNKNWHVPSEVPPADFGNIKFPNNQMNSNCKCQGQHAKFRQLNIPKANLPAFHLQQQELHASWPSDIDGFHHRRPRRTMIGLGKRRLCHPIAGGAPFVTCCNCTELLKLPRKFKFGESSKHKLQCGACSAILLFKTENKRTIVSVLEETKQIPAQADIVSSHTSKNVLLPSDGCLNGGGVDRSYDFINQAYDFTSAEFKETVVSEDQRLNVSKSSKRQDLTSSSSVSFKEEESLDNVQTNVPNPAEMSTKGKLSPTLKGFPVQECLKDVSSESQLNRSENGNKSKRIDQEKVIVDKNTLQHDSLKDVSVISEAEVSFNDYLNDNTSQDSIEVTQEVQPNINKARESFFKSFIKKSFKDFSRSKQCLENEKPKVFVNGQPIPDSVVKKAEKAAGPIYPGNYWYDIRSGFWGVIGHPCQGIIPPSIEEFNYPLAVDCAAGDTSVFVNGRELHQKDLDLLASRGLPTTRGKYLVDIWGRVIDEDSGKELDRLGKLAPTVVKLKRGFGMKVSRKLL